MTMSKDDLKKYTDNSWSVQLKFDNVGTLKEYWRNEEQVSVEEIRERFDRAIEYVENFWYNKETDND